MVVEMDGMCWNSGRKGMCVEVMVNDGREEGAVVDTTYKALRSRNETGFRVLQEVHLQEIKLAVGDSCRILLAASPKICACSPIISFTNIRSPAPKLGGPCMFA